MKSVINRLFLICGIFASIGVVTLTTSCENFLSNNNLKNELEKLIDEANAEKCNIAIFAYSSQGTLTAEKGSSYSVGSAGHKLGFTENAGWQFVEYQVYNSDSQKTGCTEQDAIYIKNPYSSETEFAVNGSADNYKIEAVCKPRPAVKTFSPVKINGGVNADSNIEITFAESVSKDSFVLLNRN